MRYPSELDTLMTSLQSRIDEVQIEMDAQSQVSSEIDQLKVKKTELENQLFELECYFNGS